MAPVTVMLLGPPRVEREGRAVAFDTRKAIALLAYLALGGRPRPRDVLAELLWPERDAEPARGVPRRTLSAVRGAAGAEALETTRDAVALGAVDVDVARFRALAEGGELGAAADVLRGDFLEGFGLPFEDWQRGEADVLRRELATVLGQLAERSGSLAHARRWLELGDPGARAAALNNLADLLHESGRADEAMDQLKQAVAIFAEVGDGEPQPGVWKLARW